MISKLIKKFFNTSKNVSEVKNNLQEYTDCNAIIFILDSKNENSFVDIKLYINDTSDHAAKQFGTLLYSINESFYAHTFLQMMNDITKDNPEYSLFMNQAIQTWSKFFNKLKAEDNSQEPIVPPSSFYSNK